MSFQPAVRPWLATSVRSCSRLLKRNVHATVTTRQFEHEEKPRRLETLNDWADFQVQRGGVSGLIKTMSQYGSRQNSAFKPSDVLRSPPSTATISALLAAGAHFGHASARMNPNFMPYAYGTRAGITIIDLDHTLPLLRRAANLVRAVTSSGGHILFIGTRPDLRPIVERAAERLGQQGFYVGERWIPGTLTNRFQYFDKETLEETAIVPSLVILLNPIENIHAIRECTMLHVPTIGIVDSNADPRIVMYPIPANDESTRAAELICGVLSIAGREGISVLENIPEEVVEEYEAALKEEEL
ncbi:ribosomal protein S2, flavodoxin-like domain-containing protein [Cyathus striatus]|nr:ribosomal protein S2, flavodoxin-like domain-containing protein [Cyathus striatus]